MVGRETPTLNTRVRFPYHPQYVLDWSLVIRSWAQLFVCNSMDYQITKLGLRCSLSFLRVGAIENI